MGIIPNFMPNPKTAVFPTAVLFYTVNVPDCPVDFPTLRARASFGVFCGFLSTCSLFVVFRSFFVVFFTSAALFAEV